MKLKTGPLGMTLEQVARGVDVLKRHLNDQHQANECAGIAARSRDEFLRTMGWTDDGDDHWKNKAVDGYRSPEEAVSLTKQALDICGFLPPS